jgi:hypothetical protein
MGVNFSKLKIGSLFEVDGETYRKTTELTYDDMAKIERYIDPFFDKRISGKATSLQPGVNTSARIVKDSEIQPVKPKKAKNKKAKKAAK